MGEVYEAVEARLNRRVAMKVVARQNLPSDQADEIIRRFMNEGRVLAQVSHPHLVTLFAVEELNGIQVLVMEYVNGIPLNDVFSRYVLSADEAVPLIMQLLEGVAALHRNNILHRDLKPSNLILRPDGNLKILDLGIAKNLEDANHTAAGVLVGTFNYLPPEVILGAPATRRSDLWSIGAIFYESLAGISLTQAQSKKTGAALEFPPEASRWTPLEVRRIVSRLCSPKPEHRYESAEAVLKDLETFRRGRPAPQQSALVALAKTVENLPEARRVLEASNLSSVNVKRALAVSAIMQAHSLSRPTASSDDTDVVTLSGGLTLDKKTVEMAMNQFKDSPAGKMHAPLRFEPQPSSHAFGRVVFALMMAALAGLAWKRFYPHSAANLKLVTALSPNSYELAGAERVTLQWTPPLSEANVQVSHDRKFIALDANGVVSTDHFFVMQDLSDGHYFWRLVNAGNRIAAGPFSFDVRHLRPLTPLAPAAEQKIDMATAEKLKITLAWKCESETHSYHVEISNRPQFTQPMTEMALETCQTESPALAPGEYYWRVNRKAPNDGDVNWSEVRHFSLIRNAAPVPVAEQPKQKPNVGAEQAAHKMEQALGDNGDSGDEESEYQQPANDEPQSRTPAAQIETPQNLSNNVIFKGRAGVGAVELRWSPSMDAENYRVEVSPTDDFAAPKKYRSTATTMEVKLRGFHPGALYWRVRAEKGDSHSHWSDPGSFQYDSN